MKTTTKSYADAVIRDFEASQTPDAKDPYTLGSLDKLASSIGSNKDELKEFYDYLMGKIGSNDYSMRCYAYVRNKVI